MSISHCGPLDVWRMLCVHVCAKMWHWCNRTTWRVGSWQQTERACSSAMWVITHTDHEPPVYSFFFCVCFQKAEDFTLDTAALEDGKGKCPYDPAKGHTGLIVGKYIWSFCPEERYHYEEIYKHPLSANWNCSICAHWAMWCCYSSINRSYWNSHLFSSHKIAMRVQISNLTFTLRSPHCGQLHCAYKHSFCIFFCVFLLNCIVTELSVSGQNEKKKKTLM